MKKRMPLALLCAAAASLAVVPTVQARPHASHAALRPLAVEAPDTPAADGDAGPACTTPAPVHEYAVYHCYRPDQIVAHYGIGQAQKDADYGKGQTIVLVDAYGSPTADADLKQFHDTFFPDDTTGEFTPDFEQVFPFGKPDYKNTGKGNGQSGPAGAEGWAGEATLDIEWAYAMAPKAHIVLLAVPPAETEGVQGFPNLFKAMSQAVDHYPPGTIFSQSFGVTEETFGGAAQTQTKRFDAIYKKGNDKGDTFLASSGDDGSLGVAKQHRETAAYDHPTVGWPASSPYVTAVGGTQLQDGWTWNPVSDTPFTTDPDNPYNLPYWQWTDGGDQDVVWNESWASIATGGGKSLIYGRPSFQDSVQDVTGDSRGVPDVAWDAAVNGGVLAYQSFFPNNERVGWHVYGGTSAASPQVAGVLALVNKLRHDDGKQPLGWANPALYDIDASAFKDVVAVDEGTADSGNLDDNQLWVPTDDGSVTKNDVPGFDTTDGYDLTTGRGTPNGQSFVDALRARP